GSLSPFAVPVLLIACLVYAAFAASVGLWFSLMCRTTLKAMFWTLFVLVLAGGGHRIMTWFLDPLLRGPKTFEGYVNQRPILFHESPDWLEATTRFQTYGLTPTATLNWLAAMQELEAKREPEIWISIPTLPPTWSPLKQCLIGLICYAA